MSSTGTVYQRNGDARWVARVTLPNGKRVARYAATEREARQRLNEMIGQHHTGTLVAPAKMTFEQWAREWLRLSETRCRAKTLENYEYGLRPLIADFGRVRLDKLTPIRIAHTFAEMQRAGAGSGRLNS